MRNKVKLYIEGTQADLDNGSFLLLNYTAEDLSNPTIVKNSFSRQITLKGTPRNDAIFGHIYRNDRDTVYGSPYTGPNFDPTRKTSFAIYNERNEILESGYLKLDEVSITKKGHTFKCTLFGGLGSFLYGLSYKPTGEKMTLADLYYDESTFDGSFSFRITREAVADAWARLGGDITKDAMWSVINFMPSYLGLPSSPFDAQKCLVLAATSGLKYRDGDYSTNPNGYTLVTLNEKVTANEAKDFRSYLQKPVMKFESIIRAICDSNYNGGYQVIPLPFFSFFHSSLLEGANAIPEGDYREESMKSTVVPFRNGIMLSIAAGIAESNGLKNILIANHFGDHAIYPDCRRTFIEAMCCAVQEGTYEGITILAPYTNITKDEIARHGAALGVDYSRTYSCYKGGEKHCGKCGTCVERKEAFQLAGIEDPTIYEE